MEQVEACLIDVYETVLSCDFTELPALVGVSADAWNEAYSRLAPQLTDGRLTMAGAHHRVLRAAGSEAPPELVQRLVERDQELLIETTHLHDDTIPFLTALQRRGIATAFVSNCADNTRPLLAHLGLLPLVDVAVLSCEAGHAKPAAGIFAAALEQLNLAARQALFIDDQSAYCAGAVEHGVRAVQIRRGAAADRADPGGWPVVSSLRQIELLL